MGIFKHGLAALAIVAVFAFANTGGALAGGHSAETKKVVEHHLDAFGKADMAAVMSDYTDTSVIITPGGELRGKEAIQGLFTALFAEFAKPGASFDLQTLVAEGNIGYIVWAAETADNVYEVGTDTFLVEGSKIMVQTLAFKAVPKK